VQNNPVSIYSLITQLASTSWLIEREAAQNYLMLAMAALSDTNRLQSVVQALESEKATEKLVFVSCSRGMVNQAQAYDDVPAGSIAMHYVTGPLMKIDSWRMGMASMGKTIQLADAHPNIIAHVAIVNTPGGTVDGTEEFSRVISGTQKPFVTFVDGLMASAGVWSFSGSNEIWAGGRTARIGSIGTMISFLDTTGMMEKFGIREVRSRADDSKDKNESFYQLIEGNDGPIKVEMLNPLNNVFLSDLQTKRAGKIKLDKPGEKGQAPEPLTGKVYLAETALSYGLIDNIGTLEQAIARAAELADVSTSEASTNATTNPNSNTMFGNKYPKTTALKGKTADQITLEDINGVNEELSAAGITGVSVVNAQIIAAAEQATADLEQTTAQLTTATASLNTLTAQVATLTKERDEAQALATKYGALSGASHTNARKDGQESQPSLAEDSQKLIDELPHNQEADNNILIPKAK
jgi:ClpP class serine protease